MENTHSKIPVNKLLTEITDELLSTLPEEVVTQLYEYINTVPYIQRLISPDRGYAKDRPRDDLGRIIVDLTNPHILEDMDYFRPSAIHYQKYGTFTSLRPNGNRNSDYYKWLQEERRRCWEGYVRPSDGEWVTGYMYWYLNYSQMTISKVREGKKSKKVDRKVMHPEVWDGVYLRFHYIDQAMNGGLYNEWLGGNHGAELASRGKSKSYSMATIVSKNFILGENEEASENVNSMVTAYLKEYLIKDGVLNKFLDTIDFTATTTLFPRARIKNSLNEMTWKLGHIDKYTGVELGKKNQVFGVSSKDDESKTRGKRMSFIGVEEFGTFPRLIDLYNVMIPSVEEGDLVFGFMYLLGTAGDSESDFAGALEIMYNPDGYNMYGIPNIYDKVNNGRPKFVYFFPGYLSRKPYIDKDGNSDIIGALISILKNRHRVKYNSQDPNTIIKTIAEVPITPAEAIVKIGVNIFPVLDLTERLLQLDTNPKEINSILVGDIVYDGKKAEFKPTGATPIRNYPNKDSNTDGAIEIAELPVTDKDGNVYTGRYVIGVDPLDDDAHGTTLSLGSVYVLDLLTDRVVAWYTGRPLFVNDLFEIIRKLALLYKASINYENNKKGLFGYFQTLKSGYLLMDNPAYLKDKQMIKEGTYGNQAKGTYTNVLVKKHGLMLLRNWLMRPITILSVNEEGEEVETTMPTLYTIKDRALLQELINYNEQGNFDRIMAMVMLMIAREDRMVISQGDLQRFSGNNAPSKARDPYFTRNYTAKSDESPDHQALRESFIRHLKKTNSLAGMK